MNKTTLFAFLIAAHCTSAAWAHHSFAVFFSSEAEVVSIKGIVRDFKFTNPHGIVEIATLNLDGKEEIWRAETNAPSILQRRGWSKTSIRPGETITLSGWVARDGSKYMRLRTATRADGTLVGNFVVPSPAAEVKK